MAYEYVINPDDETISDVKSDEFIYSFNPTVLHKFDESFEELYHAILEDNEIFKFFEYPRIGANGRFVKNSIKLWDSLGFTLHNVNVFNPLVNSNKFKEINEAYLRSFSLKHPSKVPLKYKSSVTFSDSRCSFNESLDEKTNQIYIIFRDILIPRYEKKCAATMYAHELAHTQLVTVDGGTNSIFNEETIPMLMEHIFADYYGFDTTLRVRCARLMTMVKYINLLDLGNKVAYKYRVDLETALVSGFQAIALSNIYLNGSDEVKREMIRDLNKVYNGETIVEYLLNKYECHFEDVPKDIKSLKLTR